MVNERWPRLALDGIGEGAGDDDRSWSAALHLAFIARDVCEFTGRTFNGSGVREGRFRPVLRTLPVFSDFLDLCQNMAYTFIRSSYAFTVG
jgi:hypothetical protein